MRFRNKGGAVNKLELGKKNKMISVVGEKQKNIQKESRRKKVANGKKTTPWLFSEQKIFIPRESTRCHFSGQF